MQIDIEVSGIHEAIAELSKLSRTAKEIEPIHREIGNMIQNSIEESFEKEASPFGKAWTPSKKASGKTLTDTGTLSSSFTVDADDDEVRVGTNLVYAPIHQFGGKAGRKRSVTLPARPFLPVKGGELESGLKEEIMAYLAKKLQSA